MRFCCQNSCQNNQACPAIDEKNRLCYRAQCYQTSRALAAALGLSDQQYTVSFQSRLGRTPWIEPYTDLMLPKLAEKGIKRLMVCCPSFTVDCLETLEEIGIAAKAQWLELGGESFHLVPSLNAHPSWVNALSQFVLESD